MLFGITVLLGLTRQSSMRVEWIAEVQEERRTSNQPVGQYQYSGLVDVTLLPVQEILREILPTYFGGYDPPFLCTVVRSSLLHLYSLTFDLYIPPSYRSLPQKVCTILSGVALARTFREKSNQPNRSPTAKDTPSTASHIYSISAVLLPPRYIPH